jgi:hypothetical protein
MHHHDDLERRRDHAVAPTAASLRSEKCRPRLNIRKTMPISASLRSSGFHS